VVEEVVVAAAVAVEVLEEVLGDDPDLPAVGLVGIMALKVAVHREVAGRIMTPSICNALKKN
uniref:B12-binding N-terminal domain-containing protein n=1 Tax=Bursaphelenchus xylophilus TaxID=6326 RepID=A0A1I7SIM8_BURXY